MADKKNNSNKETGMEFEKALARLEEIAGLLESGGESISLERSLELYEEGSRLAAMCVGRLKDAEQRITELSISSGSEPSPEEDAD